MFEVISHHPVPFLDSAVMVEKSHFIILVQFIHFCSSMLAVALDSFDIIIMDTDTRRIVREFTGHHNSVTDMVRVDNHMATRLLIY